MVGGHEVDMLWREQRLVVEVDGFAYHSGRAAFERDRRRDAALQAAAPPSDQVHLALDHARAACRRRLQLATLLQAS